MPAPALVPVADAGREARRGADDDDAEAGLTMERGIMTAG